MKNNLKDYRVKGIIPCSIIGGKYYFRQSDIADLLRQGMNGGNTSPESGKLKR